MFPSNFMVSGVESSKIYLALIINVILLLVLLTYVFIGGLLLVISCFLMPHSKNLEYLLLGVNH